MSEAEQRVLALVKKGQTDNKVIAELTGLSIYTVMRYRRLNDVSNQRPTDHHLENARCYGFETIEQAVLIWVSEGETNTTMAKRLGMSSSTIATLVKDLARPSRKEQKTKPLGRPKRS
jgi:DNA-binding NarL/FixJ family response regulator